VLDGVKYLFPGGAERLGGFLPGKPARPTSQKQHVRLGEGVLAVAPGDLLDDDSMATGTIDAPHGVQQEDEKAPEGNELEAAFGELVVSRGRSLAAGTDCPGSFAWTDGNFDALVIGAEARPLVNKSLEAVTPI